MEPNDFQSIIHRRHFVIFYGSRGENLRHFLHWKVSRNLFYDKKHNVDLFIQSSLMIFCSSPPDAAISPNAGKKVKRETRLNKIPFNEFLLIHHHQRLREKNEIISFRQMSCRKALGIKIQFICLGDNSGPLALSSLFIRRLLPHLIIILVSQKEEGKV